MTVAAAGVNRADLMQRQGFYDPPPGASAYPGLEVSGTVAAVGDEVAGLGGRRRGVRAAGRRRVRRAGGGPGRAAAAGAGGRVAARRRGAARGGLHGLVQRLPDRRACSRGRRSSSTAAPAASAPWPSSSPRRVGAHVAVTAGGPRRSSRRAGSSAPRSWSTTASRTSSRCCASTPMGPAPTSSWTTWARSTSPATSTRSPTSGRLVIIGLQGGTRAELDLGAPAAQAGRRHRDLAARPPGRGEGAIVAAVREHVWPLVARAGAPDRPRHLPAGGTPPTPTASWRPARTSARCCSLPDEGSRPAPRELVPRTDADPGKIRQLRDRGPGRRP